MRFPKFEEEWDIMFGNEIFKTVSNKKHNSDLPIVAVTQDKGVALRDDIDYKISVSDKSISTYKIIEKGDFVISLRSFQGGIEYSEVTGICSPAYTILKPICPIVDQFYKFYLKQDRYISKLNERLEGIRDGKNISFGNFSIIPLPYPILEEQQKIAKFLSLIEERISTQNKIIEKLESLIKGISQTLFRETIDWNIYKIGDILKIGSGRDYKHLKKGNVPVYGTGGYMLSVNDCLYEGESVCIGRKGTIDEPIFLKGKFWTVDTLFYTYNFQNLLPRFCYYLFCTINWLQYNEASGVPSLSKDTIEKIKVYLPNMQEQEKICSSLNAINNKLEFEKRLFLAYQVQKKFLLAKMFI